MPDDTVPITVDDSYTPPDPIVETPAESVVSTEEIIEPIKTVVDVLAGLKEESTVVEAAYTKEQLLRKIEKCLNEHDGLESNIGIPHDYWNWLTQLRDLNSKS